jgi:transcriptional regulator with PAS, ATPase and Fis domain
MNQRDVFLAGAGYTPPRRRKSRKVKNLKDLKMENVRNALSAFGGNRRKAAERLGIHRTTLWRWLQDAT